MYQSDSEYLEALQENIMEGYVKKQVEKFNSMSNLDDHDHQEWSQELEFYEQKQEQLPSLCRSIEPLNKYLKLELIDIRDASGKLYEEICRARLENPLPVWLRQLKHVEVQLSPDFSNAPPKFGTLIHGNLRSNTSRRPGDVGPLCLLCNQPITESRCVRLNKSDLYHCWHFRCSFCFKGLKELDFTMDQNNRPHCINCFMKLGH